jgi:hypothetical protein
VLEHCWLQGRHINTATHLDLTTTKRRSGLASLPAVSFAVYVTTYASSSALGRLVLMSAMKVLLQVSVLLSSGCRSAASAGRLQRLVRARGETALPSTLSYAVAPASE